MLYDSNNCPFKSPIWITIQDTTDKKSEIELTANLSAYAKLLSVVLNKSDTSSLPQLRAELNKNNNQSTSRKANVSQDFYEYYTARSIEMCGIWSYIKKNKFSDTGLKRKYEDLLYKMQVDFQKRSYQNSQGALINIQQNNLGSGTQNNFNNLNNIFLHPEDTIDQKNNYIFELADDRKSAKIYPKHGNWGNAMCIRSYSRFFCYS